jgi:tetratricopeptide (TPR) repeat protein
MFRSASLRRRHFLLGGFALPFFPRLGAQNQPLVDAGFHLHPHYRSATALDAVIRKVDADFDDFAGEKQHERIAAILAEWRVGLLAWPKNTQAIEKALAADFLGASQQAIESRIVRPGPALEVRQIAYPAAATLDRSRFLQEFHSDLSRYSAIETAELEVTGIETAASGRLRTRVRYELVGSGPGFYREQRAGAWDLEWEAAVPGQYRVRRWMAVGETRSRSAGRWYADIARQAFGRVPSWERQMLHGVDYWRTVLDGASGIDIYGHNGVSVGDVDGDGRDDIYVCQPAGLPNRLFRNRGDGTFDDITEVSGVGLLDNTACAIIADIDNDGRQDLIVVRANGPLLFLNQGGGKFLPKPGAFQFATPPAGTFTGAAAADYDRDGWLDIYFCLYTYYQGADQYKYPVPYYSAENGPPNFLMRNQRDGTFRDVTTESGLQQNNTRYSFCCGWGDANGDGWPDLYVVNDFGRKNLYRNNGDGSFTDVAPAAAVEDAGAGMSVCWLDTDNDGAEDLYVANMWTAAGERVSSQEIFQPGAPAGVRELYRKHAMGNSLFRNRGDGTFQNATAFEGGGMGRWSWSSDAWDFDHDGFPDLYVVNGMLSGALREDVNSFFWRQVVGNSPAEARQSPEYEQGWNAVNELIRADYTWSGFERNVFYANNGDGTLSNVSAAVGLDFPEDGRSFALADFDGDGRQEVLLKNRNAPQMRLLKNVAGDLPPSISFRLRGVKSNRDAIGAAITIGRQTRRVQAGSGFLSQHSKEVFFGLGQARGGVTASIRWPDGTVQQFRDLPVNHRIWVEEGAATTKAEPFQESRAPAISEAPSSLETLPAKVETWLLAPMPAPDFSLPDSTGQLRTLSAYRGKPVLLTLQATASHDPQLVVAIGDSRLAGSDDVAATYSILYRYLFDRRREMTLPVSFLINEQGEIVKVYQGPVDPGRVATDSRQIPGSVAGRLALGLPFPGNAESYACGRNHLSFGAVFFQRGYLEQSEQFFRLALGDDRSSAEAYYGLGSVYLKQEKHLEAQASFLQAAKLEPAYPDTVPNAWNNLGLLATREGRTDEAVACFEEALKRSPDYWIALENLGNAYRQLKRWEEARAALERAVAARPRDPEANYSLAMVFAQTDDTAQAYDYLQKALRLRPDYPEALNNLGVLYLRTGKRDDAVATFQHCINAFPAFDQSYLNLARVYSLEGKPGKAREVLLDLLKQRPDHPQARQALEQLR